MEKEFFRNDGRHTCLSSGELRCSKRVGTKLSPRKHSEAASVSDKRAAAAPKIFVNPLPELPTPSKHVNRTLAGIPRSTSGTYPTTCCPPADECRTTAVSLPDGWNGPMVGTHKRLKQRVIATAR